MIDKESISSLVINLLDEAARGVIRKKYSAVGGVKRVKRSVNIAQANKNSGQTPRQRARSAIKRNKTKRKKHGRVVTKQQIRKTARAMNKRPD